MSVLTSNSLVIRTPEGVSFSLLPASPVTRFFAWCVDLACVVAVIFVFSMVLLFVGIVSMDVAGAITILLYFAVSAGYGIVTEWFLRGQTLGKRLFHLRVVDEQGLRLKFSQIAIRNLLRVVDSLPLLYLVGGLAVLISRRGQRLGDYAANTIVIRHCDPPAYHPFVMPAGKYNSFRAYPRLEARLRQLASPEEASLLLRVLARRKELDPKARIELMRDMAAHFRSLVKFPEDTLFGLTDEQYLVNAADSIFRARSGEQDS